MIDELEKRKYKDENPINTIKNIKNILYDLKIFPIESTWNNSLKEYYSVRLSIPKTTLGTNGKGTTPQFALASAYGELMERLQNQAPYRLSIDLSKDAYEYCGFYYAPDEKYFTINELLSHKSEWLQYQILNTPSNIDIIELLKQWMKITYEKIPCDFITLPYININSGELSYIPVKMASKLYMSNGMCAGNTMEEALLQGLSEIIERYVNRRILLDSIAPPTIPNYYINKYPKIKSMMEQISSTRKYKIILKDCSLNENLPVVAAIIIDIENQSYFVKFGSHPIFEIAAERTLTELLQGQNINKLRGMTPFIYNTNTVDKNNVLQILVNGIGQYPINFFSSKPNYPFYPFKEYTINNNKELLLHLIDFLGEKGFEIYIRDVSYLGFPSYHIIIPGLSEVEEFSDIQIIKDYSIYNFFKSCFRNYKSISDKDKFLLVRLLEEKKYNLEGSISSLIGASSNLSLPWYFLKIGWYITAFYISQNDYKNACRTFNLWLISIKDNKFYEKMIPYFNCISNYLLMKMNNLSDTDIFSLLQTFYSADMVKQVYCEFDINNLFNDDSLISCFNCNNCKHNSHCEYSNCEKVYSILKFQNSINIIDQNKLLNNLYNKKGSN